MNMVRMISQDYSNSYRGITHTNIRCRLKWPNDIVAYDGREMGGILIESDDSEFMKVGIGINRESNNKND